MVTLCTDSLQSDYSVPLRRRCSSHEGHYPSILTAVSFVANDRGCIAVCLSVLSIFSDRANDGGVIAVCLSVFRPRVLRLFLENNRTLVTSAFVRQCNCEKTFPFKENHLLKRIRTLPRPVPETQRGGGVTVKGGFQARRTSQRFNGLRTYV